MAARAVIAEILETITCDSTERTICEQAKRLLTEQGLPDTWYYNCPALVLLGSRSCLSISGRNYAPSDEPVGAYNLVTIDLSPCRGPLWGDYARSIFVENGVARTQPMGDEFLPGFRLITTLHEDVCRFATRETTFEELYQFANSQIVAAGFKNLDFSGNVGHSIVMHLHDRCYIEAGNQRRLGEVACFTFEPHVRALDRRWGFKHENIYFFNQKDVLEEL